MKDTSRTVRPSTNQVFVQGKEIELPMMLAGEYNFIQLDEAAEAFGYRAVVDNKSKTIGLTQDEYFGSPYLPQFNDYLKNNQITINTAASTALTDTDLDPYKVYLVGEHTPIKGKVCSIMTNYINCFYMNSTTGESTPIAYSQSAVLSKLLDQNSQTDLTLFPLARSGSPFVSSGFTDAFQYYLCVKNSPTATPYGELERTQQ